MKGHPLVLGSANQVRLCQVMCFRVILHLVQTYSFVMAHKCVFVIFVPESVAKGSSAGFTSVVLMRVIARCHCKESSS